MAALCSVERKEGVRSNGRGRDKKSPEFYSRGPICIDHDIYLQAMKFLSLVLIYDYVCESYNGALQR
jgi:hypothetical protein